MDVKEKTSSHELKMTAGITRVRPESQILWKGEQCMDDKPLTEHGLNGSIAKAQTPATVQLAFSRPRLRKVRDPRSDPVC